MGADESGEVPEFSFLKRQRSLSPVKGRSMPMEETLEMPAMGKMAPMGPLQQIMTFGYLSAEKEELEVQVEEELVPESGEMGGLGAWEEPAVLRFQLPALPLESRTTGKQVPMAEMVQVVPRWGTCLQSATLASRQMPEALEMEEDVGVLATL